MTECSDDDRVPVTVITGFLGSGKTTLLNALIHEAKRDRIAVIINEFGDIGLDHDLIEDATEETILMPSGCLCCSIRGDLVETLGALMARRNRADLHFDRVIIETTGIADPAPILHSLVVDQVVGPYYRMDGIVTLVDAATGPLILDDHYEAVHQAAVADLIIVTKTDLVSPDQVAGFEHRLEMINSTAKRIHATHGRVPAGALFGRSAMRKQVTSQGLDDWLGHSRTKAARSTVTAQLEQGADTAHPEPQPHAHHNHSIVSASIELPDPISADAFDFWLDSLIALRGSDILRVKGIVFLEDMDWPFVFHGVQHIFDAPVALKSWAGKDRSSRIVVIAREMSKRDLNASLQMLHRQPQDEDHPTDSMMAPPAAASF